MEKMAKASKALPAKVDAGHLISAGMLASLRPHGLVRVIDYTLKDSATAGSTRSGCGPRSTDPFMPGQ